MKSIKEFRTDLKSGYLIDYSKILEYFQTYHSLSQSVKDKNIHEQKLEGKEIDKVFLLNRMEHGYLVLIL